MFLSTCILTASLAAIFASPTPQIQICGPLTDWCNGVEEYVKHPEVQHSTNRASVSSYRSCNCNNPTLHANATSPICKQIGRVDNYGVFPGFTPAYPQHLVHQSTRLYTLKGDDFIAQCEIHVSQTSSFSDEACAKQFGEGWIGYCGPWRLPHREG
jgi:hypothetical protein